jgi:hypothetical protein
VFGGFFLGAGIGFAIRGGAVLDGTEIAALLISRRGDLLRVGDVILGFNGSATDQFISSYAAVGQRRSGRTTFEIPILLKKGEATYAYKLSPNMRRNRWGDYSGSVVDPENPWSFWTFQEFVLKQDRWGTQITQIQVSPK